MLRKKKMGVFDYIVSIDFDRFEYFSLVFFFFSFYEFLSVSDVGHYISNVVPVSCNDRNKSFDVLLYQSW